MPWITRHKDQELTHPKCNSKEYKFWVKWWISHLELYLLIIIMIQIRSFSFVREGFAFANSKEWSPSNNFKHKCCLGLPDRWSKVKPEAKSWKVTAADSSYLCVSHSYRVDMTTFQIIVPVYKFLAMMKSFLHVVVFSSLFHQRISLAVDYMCRRTIFHNMNNSFQMTSVISRWRHTSSNKRSGKRASINCRHLLLWLPLANYVLVVI